MSARRPLPRLPLALPGMRIGLLGGSFDPAHAAHRHISEFAIKRIGLDALWWLVTPGNPLKRGSAPLADRLAAARVVARHPRIAVTAIEADLGSPYTVDTLAYLQRRYPEVRFVWIMGADAFAGLDHWKDWRTIVRKVRIAVVDRPGHRLALSAGKAAQSFAAARIDESDARALPLMRPPAWCLLSLPLMTLSSTEIRRKSGRAH